MDIEGAGRLTDAVAAMPAGPSRDRFSALVEQLQGAAEPVADSDAGSDAGRSAMDQLLDADAEEADTPARVKRRWRRTS